MMLLLLPGSPLSVCLAPVVWCWQLDTGGGQDLPYQLAKQFYVHVDTMLHIHALYSAVMCCICSKIIHLQIKFSRKTRMVFTIKSGRYIGILFYCCEDIGETLIL